MQIPDLTLRKVVFLVSGGQPRASAFFVLVEDDEYAIKVPYVVTARHCIEETAGRPFFVRINAEDGYRDEETTMDDWWLHDTEDVAAIRYEPNRNLPPLHIAAESLETFIEADYHLGLRPMWEQMAQTPGFVAASSGKWTGEGFEQMERAPVQVGHEVFLVSLLYEQPGERRNLPIARFGHISRMPEEPILMQRTGGTTVPITAYLVECHSWGGHSGCPVYWTHPMTIYREVPKPGKEGEVMYTPEQNYVVALMGLVSGHWDIEQEAKTEGDFIGSIRTAINSGIAVVTPAAAIHDLLTRREDVVEDRKEAAKKARAEVDAQRAITPDSAAMGEFEQFEDLTRKLVNVPKKEIDQKRKDEA